MRSRLPLILFVLISCLMAWNKAFGDDIYNFHFSQPKKEEPKKEEPAQQQPQQQPAQPPVTIYNVNTPQQKPGEDNSIHPSQYNALTHLYSNWRLGAGVMALFGNNFNNFPVWAAIVNASYRWHRKFGVNFYFGAFSEYSEFADEILVGSEIEFYPLQIPSGSYDWDIFEVGGVAGYQIDRVQGFPGGRPFVGGKANFNITRRFSLTSTFRSDLAGYSLELGVTARF